MNSDVQFGKMDSVNDGKSSRTKDDLPSGSDDGPEFEIEFGQLEHSSPEPALRPDQDRHYCVAEIGSLDDSDLAIFVDMDVLRDMESHARENTRVELGGVMLGRQHVDSDGRPFVVVTDSLRARHYEATRGSFKFTHDTWNQITRERNEFRGDLEMVGWYHTHPGWGVFLSGMDLFICNHFFNRPLDVALVIDPCDGDRGWFQWSTSDPGQTRQTPGFILMTNRHRQRELNFFAEQFSGNPSGYHDPRFHQSVFSAGPNLDLEDTMINLVDNRRPIFELAIVSILTLQLLLVGLVGWRLASGPNKAGEDELALKVEELQQQLDTAKAQKESTMREQVYSGILETLVSSQTGKPGLVEQFTEMATKNQSLAENLDGQLARATLAIREKEALQAELANRDYRLNSLEKDLSETQKFLSSVKSERDEFRTRLASNGTEKPALTGVQRWILYAVAVVGLLAAGGMGGYMAGRVFSGQDEPGYRDNSMDKAPPRDGEMTLQLDDRSEIGSSTG